MTSTTHPPLQDLEKLRQQAHHIEKRFQLPHSIEMLWPQLSNTDLMNQSLGLAAPEYQWSYDEAGRPHLQGETTMAALKHKYYELPYEWDKGHFLQVERIYEKGVFSYLKYALSFKALQAQGTEICVGFDYTGFVPDMVARPILDAMLKKIQKLFEQVSERLSTQNYAVSGAGYREAAEQHTQSIGQLHERWQSLMPGSDLPYHLAEYIYTAPERYVHHLRPFEVADLFGDSRDEMLQLCLLARQMGDLEARWAMLCSSCWGAKAEAATMQDIASVHHCEACNVEYEAQLEHNLELVFSPSAQLRPTEPHDFCAGSPANTPQIEQQYLLWPEHSVTLSPQRQQGEYQLWLNKDVVLIQLSADGPSEHSLDLSQLPPSIVLTPGGQCRLQNADSLSRVRLENCQLLPDVVSAAHAYALQEFQELFSDQIPAPERRFHATNQIFVTLHWQLPEEQAWQQEELQALFTSISREHCGAPVQSTDAELQHYVFAYLNNALEAAAQMLHHFQEMQLMYQDDLQLNLVLHNSSCEVFTLENQLCFQVQLPEDFLEQLQGQGGRLVVAAELGDSASLENWLEQQHLHLMPGGERWLQFKSAQLASLSV